jgi:diacylglycerol kinase (ATP)
MTGLGQVDRPMKGRRTGLGRIITAAGHSWRGLRACWNNEAAFRQEVVVAVPLLVAGAVWPVSNVERALMLASILLVLIVELLNSGIEAAIDRIGTDHHVLSGLAKDVGSAAVTMSLLLAAVVWTCILL